MKRAACIFSCCILSLQAANEAIPSKQRITCEFLRHLMKTTPNPRPMRQWLSSMTGYAHRVGGAEGHMYSRLSPEVRKAIQTHFNIHDVQDAYRKAGCNNFSTWVASVTYTLCNPNNDRILSETIKQYFSQKQQKFKNCVTHHIDTYRSLYQDETKAGNAVRRACKQTLFAKTFSENGYDNAIYTAVEHERANSCKEQE